MTKNIVQKCVPYNLSHYIGKLCLGSHFLFNFFSLVFASWLKALNFNSRQSCSTQLFIDSATGIVNTGSAVARDSRRQIYIAFSNKPLATFYLPILIIASCKIGKCNNSLNITLFTF